MILVLCGEMSSVQKWLLRGAYAAGLMILAGGYLWKGFLVAGVQASFWGFEPIGGPGSYLQDALTATSFLYCLWILYEAYQSALDIRRNQLQYVFWGSFICALGGFVNVLMVHGVHVYPFGHIANIVFSVAVAYAIVSYQWLDIRLVLRQSVVYASLGTALTLTYIGMVYFVKKTIFANPQAIPKAIPR